MKAPALDSPAGEVPLLGLPGFAWPDLHDPLRLAELTRAFDRAVEAADAELYARYAAHRSGKAPLDGPEESALLVALAAHVSLFLGRLFDVEREQEQHRAAAGRDAPIFRVK